MCRPTYATEKERRRDAAALGAAIAAQEVQNKKVASLGDALGKAGMALKRDRDKLTQMRAMSASRKAELAAARLKVAMQAGASDV